nr:MAG TPA: hypothetical protein [Caudoviricetes sp.]
MKKFYYKIKSTNKVQKKVLTKRESSSIIKTSKKKRRAKT